MKTTSERSLRFHRGRDLISTGLLVMLTLLALAGLPSLATAQSRVFTTIFPREIKPTSGSNPSEAFETTSNVLLSFQVPTLPSGAETVKATLQLTCKDTLRDANGDVRVKVVGSGANFGSRNFKRGNPKVRQAMQWTTSDGSAALLDLKSGVAFVLELVPDQTPNPARQWYSFNDESRFRPRLILEYTVPGRAAVLESEGLPATHGSRPFLAGSSVTQLTTHAVSGMWSYAPVFSQDLVYLITGNEADAQLQALPALGGVPVWSVPVSKPGQHLVRSEAGRLYIVGAQQILVYQLDTAKPFSPPTAVKSSHGEPLSPKSVKDLKPTIAPAVGPDGSLYFVNGQEVYGLNPDLQEMWKVTLDVSRTSRLTVGPSGQFVYLLGQMAGAMSVIAIDARTGDVSAAKLPLSAALTLHAPVVLSVADGGEKVFVAANSETAGTLTCFGNSRTTVRGEKSWALGLARDWTPVNGRMSQPTVAGPPPGSPGEARTIYSVTVTGQQGRLLAIDGLKGTLKQVGGEFPVGAQPDLLFGGNLVVDALGTILIWNGVEAKLHATASQGGPAILDPFTISGLTRDSRLLFGSGGTLYALDPAPANTRMLRAILPQYTLSGDGAEHIIVSGTHVRVDGTAARATTLSVKGTVLFGSGFTVKQGVSLKIQKPNP